MPWTGIRTQPLVPPPTKACCCWVPSPPRPPSWSPSSSCWSASAAKGKRTPTRDSTRGTKERGAERNDKKKSESSRSFIISAAGALGALADHSHHPLLLLCAPTSSELFSSLLTPPSIRPLPSLLSPARSRVAVMNVNGCECQIR